VSQPYDRSSTAECPPSVTPDPELGEFWVDDPFRINLENNLSSYERNRVFLNAGGEEFLEISHLSAADSDGDGRAVVAADLDRDGREDLIVRGVGGPPLLVYRNTFPAGHWLEVSLRGTKSNRLGIGARLIATVGERRLVRDLFPINSYRSQAPTRVHFGLGAAERVDALEIRWPSGKTTRAENLQADRHYLIGEHDGLPVYWPDGAQRMD
jgi:hypothetical protein